MSAWLPLLALGLTAVATPAPGDGVVVLEVRARGAAVRAGVRARDRLLSWERGGSGARTHGVLRSQLDLDEVELEHAARGGLVLHVRRGESRLSLPAGDEGLKLRVSPACPDPLASELLTAGESLSWSGLERPEAERALSRLKTPRERALALRRLGLAWLAGGQGAAGIRALESARALLEKEPDSLALADVLLRLRGGGLRLGESEALVRRAVSIRDRLAPASHAAAHAHDALGSEYGRQGRYPETRVEYARAWELLRARKPETALHGQVLVNLGEVRFRMGDLPAGPRQVEEGFAIQERTGAPPLELADSLRTLAIIARMTGHPEEAERRLRQGLALLGGVHDRDAVMTLVTLANVQAEREDWRGARATAEEALEVCRREGLESTTRAILLGNLANYERVLGNRARAETLAREAIAVAQASGMAPSPEILLQLSGMALQAGDLNEARRALVEAEARIRVVAPRGLSAAEIRFARGDLQQASGDLAGARASWEQALLDFQRLKPGSLSEARTLQSLALLERGAGRPGRALELLFAALSRLDVAQARLGGSDTSRLLFGAAVRDLFVDTVDILVDEGRVEDALVVVERLRSRALADTISQREALRLAGAPAELLERQAANEFREDALVSQISELDPGRDRARLARLTRRLQTLREEHAALSRQATAAPRGTLLGLSSRPDLASIRSRLPAGSTWLVYLVGTSRTHLFILGPTAAGARHTVVPAGAEALGRSVAILRSLLLAGAGPRGARDPEVALTLRLHELWSLLIAPAAPELSASSRLVLSLDGPLRGLPFAALRPPGGGYLAEHLTVDVIASGTSLQQLSDRSFAGPGKGLVAFGDPEATSRGPRAPPGRRLDPLPGARAEVARIGAVLGPSSLVRTGEAATEEEAARTLPSARWAHLACHAVWDPADPLGSGLALAPSPRANGLLTIGEVLGGPQLRADVVTLSACGTAVGAALGEDGVTGLVRAFQIAGARAVVASLWNVADESTADLMASFYEGLAAGSSPDRALREAQLSLLKAVNGRHRHPYHWAGFVSFSSAAARRATRLDKMSALGDERGEPDPSGPPGLPRGLRRVLPAPPVLLPLERLHGDGRGGSKSSDARQRLSDMEPVPRGGQPGGLDLRGGPEPGAGRLAAEVTTR